MTTHADARPTCIELTDHEIAEVSGGAIAIPELSVKVAVAQMSASIQLGGSTLTISATPNSHGVTWS